MKKIILGFVLTVSVLINASEVYARGYNPVAVSTAGVTSAVIASAIASSNRNSSKSVRCADINNDEDRLTCYDNRNSDCKGCLIWLIGFILTFIISVKKTIEEVGLVDEIKNADLPDFFMGTLVSLLVSIFSWLALAIIASYYLIKRFGDKE